MKKKIILMTLVAAMMLPMVAQAEDKKTSTFVEIQPIVGDCDALNVNFGVMYNANKNLSFGGGIGLLEPYKFNVAPTIPVFVRAQAETALEGVTPFISFDAGFGACTEDFDASAVIINPMIGAKFGNVYAGIGYHGAIPTKGSGIASSINFRLGYQFAGKGISKTDVKNFFSKTYFTVEIGGGMGLSSIKEGDYDKYWGLSDEKDMTLGNNITAQISWMYKIDENWSAGIGTGFYSYCHSFSEDGYDDVWVNSLPLYVRGQYTFMNEGNMFRPYIACDLGGLIHLAGSPQLTYSKFIIEPQIGVKIKDRYRVALGYAAYKAHGNEEYNYISSESVSSLNLKIGLDF